VFLKKKKQKERWFRSQTKKEQNPPSQLTLHSPIRFKEAFPKEDKQKEG